MPKWLHVLTLLVAPLAWGLAVEYLFHRMRSRRAGGDAAGDTDTEENTR